MDVMSSYNNNLVQRLSSCKLINKTGGYRKNFTCKIDLSIVPDNEIEEIIKDLRHLETTKYDKWALQLADIIENK
jgi:hypothetical protein